MSLSYTRNNRKWITKLTGRLMPFPSLCTPLFLLFSRVGHGTGTETEDTFVDLQLQQVSFLGSSVSSLSQLCEEVHHRGFSPAAFS